MLKAKVDAGAARAHLRNSFFENDLYFRYLDRVRARGIDYSDRCRAILPVQNFKAATNFRGARRRLHVRRLARRPI